MLNETYSLLCYLRPFVLTSLRVEAWGQASVLSKAVRTSESMEPALSFPAQEQAAQSKLDALRAKTGKRPNIVWLVIDDMG